jgi:regulator of cell morphogenesis and NO signaling
MATNATHLDMVPVEPKHRFETIMAAWHALPTAGVLELNVDHDPACMYYTLRATQGEDAFSFEYLERGPLFWRVRVTKRTGD